MDQNIVKKPRFLRILSDFHMHSDHSGDSDTPMEDQIRAALSLGLSSVCFTEHLDMDWPYQNTPDLAPDTFDLDPAAYRQEYLRLRGKYRGRLDIFYGVELGLQPHLGDRLKAFAAAHPEFDFILGSTHVSRQMDPYYSIFFEGRTEEEAYRTYFTDSLLSLRAFHQIDSYGHMDYVVRYGPNQDRFYSYERYQDVIDPILESPWRSTRQDFPKACPSAIPVPGSSAATGRWAAVRSPSALTPTPRPVSPPASIPLPPS